MTRKRRAPSAAGAEKVRGLGVAPSSMKMEDLDTRHIDIFSCSDRSKFFQCAHYGDDNGGNEFVDASDVAATMDERDVSSIPNHGRDEITRYNPAVSPETALQRDFLWQLQSVMENSSHRMESTPVNETLVVPLLQAVLRLLSFDGEKSYFFKPVVFTAHPQTSRRMIPDMTLYRGREISIVLEVKHSESKKAHHGVSQLAAYMVSSFYKNVLSKSSPAPIFGLLGIGTKVQVFAARRPSNKYFQAMQVKTVKDTVTIYQLTKLGQSEFDLADELDRTYLAACLVDIRCGLDRYPLYPAGR